MEVTERAERKAEREADAQKQKAAKAAEAEKAAKAAEKKKELEALGLSPEQLGLVESKGKPKKPLTPKQKEQLKKKKEARGDEDTATIPKPTDVPEWMCCLLSCLDTSHEMQEYKRCIPQTAVVKRAGREWMHMEVSGLLVGDLVKVHDGYSVPADVRIIRSVGLCTLDPSDIIDARTYTVNENEAGDIYQCSPNMAFAGYRCESGDLIGIVVATGLNTLVGRMIKKGVWPPRV